MNWEHITFVTSTLFVLLREYIIFAATGDQLQMVKNISESLMEKNPFFVKTFQALSADCKLLNSESIDYLTKYTDSVKYDDNEVDMESLDLIQERGVVLEISDITYKPDVKHSGMVSLVYKGKINKDTEVAVKVRRKGIYEKLEVALDQFGSLMYVLSLFPFLKHFNLVPMFEENKRDLIDQLDYNKELTNLKDLYKANEYVSYVVVPNAYQQYTDGISDRVIVMDYLRGKTLQQLSTTEKKEYRECLAKFDMKCLLFDGLFHADFHQGNMLFMGETGDRKIGIIDLGVLGRLSLDEQNNFYLFFSSFLKKDYISAADAVLRNLAEPADKVEEIVHNDDHPVKHQLSDLLESIGENTHICGLSEINGMSAVLVEHGLRLSQTFSKIQLSLAIAEGVQKSLGEDVPFLMSIEKACEELFPTDLV